MGFYLMDYFLPSMMIVAISWVSFWLQADQAPPRIMLGTSTMLTFITLASAQGKTLPKVSYIKVSEVWFLGCTFFIFGSLLEFAFVNTIWRRKNNVELKKVSVSRLSTQRTLIQHFECILPTGQQQIHSEVDANAEADTQRHRHELAEVKVLLQLGRLEEPDQQQLQQLSHRSREYRSILNARGEL